MKTMRRLLVLQLLGLLAAGCTPVRVKTAVLTPVAMATGRSGVTGSKGFCLSAGEIPPSAFSPAAGQVLVGFDDYFGAGSDPFPCDDIRALNFRAGVRFDLGAFDRLSIATLRFDTASSIERRNGVAIGTMPGKSFATMLGVGMLPLGSSTAIPSINETGLPPGSAISITVNDQVADWVMNGVPNNGFVIWGPRPPIDRSNPPESNDAVLSFYQNFRLEVVYNPVLNPRAAQ